MFSSEFAQTYTNKVLLMPCLAWYGDAVLNNPQSDNLFRSGVFSKEVIWARTLTPGIASGTSIVDHLPDRETAIKNQAQVDGYTVK